MRHRSLATAVLIAAGCAVGALPGAAPARADVLSTSSLSQTVVTSSGAVVGTMAMNGTLYETQEYVGIPSTSVSLPAGTYRVSSCLSAVPAATGQSTQCPITTTVTLSVPGRVSSPADGIIATRPLAAPAGSVGGWVGVQVLRGGTWTFYASSWRGLGASSLPVPVAGAPVAQLRGVNSLAVRQQQWTDLTQLGAEMDSMHQAGADIIRTNLPWPLLQPVDGLTWDATALSYFDQYFAMASARGLRVVVNFGGTPCWASSAPLSVRGTCSGGLSNPADGYVPALLSDLQTAVTFVAARWGSSISGWEVGNEPNSAQSQQVMSPAQYVWLVRGEDVAVKAVAPRTTVIAGVLAFGDTRYLDGLYAAGMKGAYDAISVHPYNVDFAVSPAVTGDPATPFSFADQAYSFEQGMEAVRADMLAHGDGATPVWITEFGYSDCTAASTLCVTDAQQAQWLAESFQMAARWPWVPVVISYSARDNDANVQSWASTFGLLRVDGSAKPALAAVSNAWACLRAGTC